MPSSTRAVGSALLALVLCVACGPRSMQARLRHGEKLAGKAELALSSAETHLNDLEPDAALEDLAEAKKAMADPDTSLYPDASMLGERLAAAEARLPATRLARERKDLADAVAAQRTKVEQAQAELSKLLATASAQGATQDDVKAAHDALGAARGSLDEGKSLEPRDKAYATWAAAARKKLDQFEGDVFLAGGRVLFVQGPVRLFAESNARQAEAKRVKPAARRKELFLVARRLLRECVQAARPLLADYPPLAWSKFGVAGMSVSGSDLLSRCASDGAALDLKLNTLGGK